MANNATRRSLLKAATGVAAYGAGVAALSAGAAIVTADDAKGATGRVSPELTRLIAALHAATAYADRFTQEVWNPRLDRANAAYHALPHTAALNGSGMNPPIFTTENPQHIIRCRGIVSIPRSQQSQDPNWQVTYQAARKIAAADLRRQRALKRIYRETGMTEAEEMEERIYAAETKALDAVENFPAASLADMKAKLNVMVERERCEPVLVDMLTADLDRLTKREG